MEIYRDHLAPLRYGATLLALCILVALSGPLVRVARVNYTLTQDDTRTVAKEWIERHIPEGTRIAIDSGWFDVAKLSPPLSDIPENYYTTYVSEGNGPENKHLDSSKGILEKYYKLRLKVPPKRSYSLFRIVISVDGRVDERVNLENFIAEGVEYVVVSSYAYDGYGSAAYQKNHPNAAAYYTAFYERLAKRCSLAKEFPSEPRERQGPTIKIYRVAPEAIKDRIKEKT
jgi:hypothetical protein